MSEQIAVRIPEATLAGLDALVQQGRFGSRAAAVRRAIDLLLLTEREAVIADEYRRAYGQTPQDAWVGEAGLRIGAAILARMRAEDEAAS